MRRVEGTVRCSIENMKTVLVLAGLVALVAGTTLPYASHEVKTKKLDDKLIDFQKKVLELLENPAQEEKHTECWKVGKEYNIAENMDKYTNADAVATFLGFWKIGFMPKYQPFFIFNERQKDEATTLYDLFYYAKDWDTLYKTAAFVRVHLNSEQFRYAFYTAIVQRPDTKHIVLPAPYELWPEYFINMDIMSKMFAVKMQDGIGSEEYVKSTFGIYEKDSAYYFNSNYSGPMVYPDQRNWLSYLTEDIGWNAYYFYFHTQMPFWGTSEQILGPFKERRGEIYYYFYQQLLARYYLERLTNGMGEIPTFTWDSTIEAGYYPAMTTLSVPFAQRSEKYYLSTPENYKYIEFLKYWENNFLGYLQTGQCKAYKYEVDFSNSKAINFVGNYWQSNHGLYEKVPHRNYERSYDVAARHVLSPAPKSSDDYMLWPSTLDFYQTSLRDPAFYQLYSRIMEFIFQYKDYLEPYSQEILHYVGVKVNDVKVEKLYTFFEYYDFNATNAVYLTKEEQVAGCHSYIVRQPRLNHKPFSVTIDIKSDIEAEATFKVFMGPKYDGEGRPLTLVDNWMNFVELDWFTHKLTPGQNKIERHSQDFFFYKEDSVSTSKIWELLKQGQVPKDMSENYDSLPQRLMLPRGTKGGFPVQFFVFVYPHQPLNKEWEALKEYVLDNKPFGYPFDRPIPVPELFIQPNMHFEDVYIYQEGEESPRWVDGSYTWNYVPKH